MKIETTSILENAVLFSLSRWAWGNRRVADKSHLKTSDDEDANKATLASLSVTKELIRTRDRLTKDGVVLKGCKELKAIYDKLNETYLWCMNHSMPSCLRDSIYFVKKDMVQAFEDRIAKDNAIVRDELIPAFLAVYPAAIEQARIDLNGQFQLSDYPNAAQMRNNFGTKHSWLEFNVPKDLPEQVKKSETAKMKQQLQDAATELVFGLRESFAEYVDDLSRRMQVQPGTAGKRFTAPGAVENLLEFIERFNSLNIANDVELEAAVAKARDIVNGKDVVNMVNSAMSRDRVKQSFSEIRGTMETLIQDRPKRKFNFEA